MKLISEAAPSCILLNFHLSVSVGGDAIMLCTDAIVSVGGDAVYRWYRIKSVCYEHQLLNDTEI